MKLSYIDLGDGEKRPVCFSLSAIEELEDEFGSLENMQKGLQTGSVHVVNKVLEIMIRAGENYCRGMGHELPKPLLGRPGDLIDARDGDILSQITAAMKGDSDRTVQTKN